MNSNLIIYKGVLKAICLVILITFGSNSFAQSDKIIPNTGKNFCRIDSIVLTGNKITRDQVILREIIFNAGDSLRLDWLDSLISRSRENLLNTLLFNFVELNKSYPIPDSVHVIINVKVIERWYIWPTPILKLSDRNFNVWWETKDLSRLSYGFYVDWQNFRGRKEHLILRLQWGYNRVINLQYLIPYLNKKKTLGIGFGFGFARQKETAFQTVNNKQQFFKNPEGFARQDYYAYGQFLVRRNIYNTHMLELRYDQHHFSDSLLKENEHFTSDGASELKYISFRYFFKSDHRDFKSYPLKGYYFDFEIIKHGLWTFNHNTLNTFHLLATYRKFWELHPRVYFATGLNGKISAGIQPYFIMRGIGYDRDVIRSYEYYLVDAQHFVILRNNIKFALIPNQVKDISFIKTEKFGKIFYALYLNVFIDGGYGVYNQDFGRETNDLQNTLLFGYGTGLDFVTYYDVVIRLEFSVNFKNETGIFLHFMAPI
ncbi:MAG: POTRA domain-containing protein [Bacteroidales bacterium]